MATFINGPTTPWQSVNAGAIPTDVAGIAINWFQNRTPLLARLPRLPVGSPTFKITSDTFRPRSYALAADIDNSTTAPTVADTSGFGVGDVIEMDSEAMLITAIANSTTLTVTRGYAGTSAASHTAASSTIYLIGRTTTGAETSRTAQSRIPATVDQYVQVVQHSYSVGDMLQRSTNYVSGYGMPLQRDRFLCMQHVYDDMEEGMLYGRGVAIAADTTKPAQKGLRSLIVTNNTTSPTNAAAYTPQDFLRDTVEKVIANGGNPSVVLVDSKFSTGLATWGYPLQRLNAGQNVYGTPIDVFEAPFISGLRFIYHPLLRPYTAVCLSIDEVVFRQMADLYEKVRGSAGAATEGDMIMMGAIELQNEQHHAWVSGITAFSAS